MWTIPAEFTNKSYPDTGVRLFDVDVDGLPDLMQSLINTSTSTSTNISNTWLNNGSGWYVNNTWVVPDALVKNGSNAGRRLADVNGDGFPDLLISATGSVQNPWLRNCVTLF